MQWNFGVMLVNWKISDRLQKSFEAKGGIVCNKRCDVICSYCNAMQYFWAGGTFFANNIAIYAAS